MILTSKGKSQAKTTHVIEVYKHQLDRIWCICGWEGSTTEYKEHKIVAPPLEHGYVNAWKQMYGYRGSRYLPSNAVMREMSGFLDELSKEG